jgi:hypothetical protein
MKTIDEMDYYVVQGRRDRRYVGRVRDFPDLHTSPKRSAADAISDIVTMTVERIQDLHEVQSMNVNGGRPA